MTPEQQKKDQEEIKQKVNESVKEAWNIVVAKLDSLDLKDDGARWLFAQRVFNMLWLRANPHASYIIQKQIEEMIND